LHLLASICTQNQVVASASTWLEENRYREKSSLDLTSSEAKKPLKSMT
jgi:hypothetical protein